MAYYPHPKSCIYKLNSSLYMNISNLTYSLQPYLPGGMITGDPPRLSIMTLLNTS